MIRENVLSGCCYRQKYFKLGNQTNREQEAGQKWEQNTGTEICAKLAWAEMTQLSCSQGQLGTYGSLTLFTSRTKINEKSIQQSIAIIKYLLV